MCADFLIIIKISSCQWPGKFIRELLKEKIRIKIKPGGDRGKKISKRGKCQHFRFSMFLLGKRWSSLSLSLSLSRGNAKKFQKEYEDTKWFLIKILFGIEMWKCARFSFPFFFFPILSHPSLSFLIGIAFWEGLVFNFWRSLNTIVQQVLTVINAQWLQQVTYGRRVVFLAFNYSFKN